MNHYLPQIRRWQRWLLLLIVFLSLGKGSANATVWRFDERCSITSQPMVNIVLGRDDPSYNHDAADVNGDGKVSLADVTALTNFLKTI